MVHPPQPKHCHVFFVPKEHGLQRMLHDAAKSGESSPLSVEIAVDRGGTLGIGLQLGGIAAFPFRVYVVYRPLSRPAEARLPQLKSARHVVDAQPENREPWNG